MTLPAELRAEADRRVPGVNAYYHDEPTRALLQRAADALEWRGIESAPDDGRDILAFWHDDCIDHHRVVFRSCTNDWSDGIDLYQPTHWLPLPATPEGDNNSTNDEERV